MLATVGLLVVTALVGHFWLAPRTHKLTVAMMPKAKGDPYFVSCRQGAEEAAKELGVELLWDGPTELDPAKQNEVVEGWITRGVDVIAVSVDNVAGISTVLRKARARGIGVLTWDADAEPDARDFFINQATRRASANPSPIRSRRFSTAKDPSQLSPRRSPPRIRTSGSSTSSHASNRSILA
jgi:ABC-type sugar transport system substrate-binding protein